MVYPAVGAPGREDLVIVLLTMPGQRALTLAASSGTLLSKKRLHERAVVAMDRMPPENSLPAVHWYKKKEMGRMVRVAS